MNEQERTELPRDPEAEKCLLACLLLDDGADADAVLAMAAECGVTAKHLDDLRYRYLWQSVQALRQQDPPVTPDFPAMLKILREHEKLGPDGPPLLQELSIYLPSARNAKQYLDQVVEAWQRRTLIIRCLETAQIAYGGAKVTETTTALIEGLQAELADISAVASASSAFTPIKKLLIDAYTALEARYKMRGRFSGITTGIADLDRMTDGFQAQQVILIPGRPSMGKSAGLFQFGLHAARSNSYSYRVEEWKRSRIAVGGFSAEMGDLLLGERLLAQISGISIKTFATGFMSKADFHRAQQKLAMELDAMEGIVFEIDDTPGISIQQLEARARWLVMQKKVRLLMVDYAQLLTSNSKKAERSRLEEVSEVSLGLKRIARTLNVPVIVAVQLNRDVDDRPGHVPMLSDMRECGQLEQDADIVIAPVRPEYYAKSDDQKAKALSKYKLDEMPLDSGPAQHYLAQHWTKMEGMTDDELRLQLLEAYAELYVIKNRGGPTGMIKCWYHKEKCWFEGWTQKAFSNDEDERQANLGENHGEVQA